MAKDLSAPNLAHEMGLWARGYRYVAGLDEAGRGAWAGPVVAAAVVLPSDRSGLIQQLDGVRDSKLLTAVRREHLLEIIVEHALTWATGAVPPEEIDRLGIVPATRGAMTQAVDALSPAASYLLIDYLALPVVPLPQYHLPKGVMRVLSIAAASIVAKVHRDRMMVDLDASYPGYGFAQHKGYGTAQHRAALAALGPCPAHRMSFAPLRWLNEPPPG